MSTATETGTAMETVAGTATETGTATKTGTAAVTSDLPYERLLRVWFGEPGGDPLANMGMWFKKSDALDAELREQFGEDAERGLRGELDGWKATLRGTVAFIVLLDQITRNVRRGTPGAFAGDPQALAACLDVLARGLDRELAPVERWFVYMPLMHSEDLGHQRRCVELFERLAEETSGAVRAALGPAVRMAVRHLEIVERFGRFPHRNEVLGRVSTEEEIAFLKEPNSSF